MCIEIFFQIHSMNTTGGMIRKGIVRRGLISKIPDLTKPRWQIVIHNIYMEDELYGRTGECHNEIRQPIPSTKRKRKLLRTETTKLSSKIYAVLWMTS